MVHGFDPGQDSARRSVIPRRPAAHVIGDQATSAVAKVFSDAGFAAERVVNDYGEDLLVQTAHAGRMDASRLWVQVKGARSLDRYKRRDGTYRFPFSVDHVMRWLRSADPVVVVLWDVTDDVGFAAWPLSQVTEWQRFVKDRQTIRLSFGTDPFTPKEARDLAWVARFAHYWRLLVMAQARDEILANLDVDTPRPMMLASTVALDFLDLLEIVGLSGIHGQIRPEAAERMNEIMELLVDRIDDVHGGEAPDLDELLEENRPEAVRMIAAGIFIEERAETLAGFRLEEPHQLIPPQLFDAALRELMMIASYVDELSLASRARAECELRAKSYLGNGRRAGFAHLGRWKGDRPEAWPEGWLGVFVATDGDHVEDFVVIAPGVQGDAQVSEEALSDHLVSSLSSCASAPLKELRAQTLDGWARLVLEPASQGQIFSAPPSED